MISFVKAHACGNDFLILEESLAKGKHAELARTLCARNTSIGADGIEFVEWKGRSFSASSMRMAARRSFRATERAALLRGSP
jgi:diaminopimelate epimerase